MKKSILGIAGLWTVLITLVACQTTGSSTDATPKESDAVSKELLQWEDTPLHRAARLGQIDQVAAYLAKGASLQALNVFGETPLHAAIAAGHSGTAALLASQGGNISSEDGFGYSPAALARENGFPGFEKQYTALLSGMGAYKGNLPLAAKYLTWAARPAGKRQSGESWSDYVARSVSSRLEEWLSLADLDYPPEIQQPQTPPPIEITQEQWETNAEFEQRVAIKQRERQDVVNALQDEYRQKVEARNREIAALKQIQNGRMAELPDYRAAFAQFAMGDVFSTAIFTEAVLDKDSGDLYLNGIQSSGENLGRFVIKGAGRELRQAAFENQQSLVLNVEPFADKTGNFGISGVSVSLGSTVHKALPTSQSANTQALLTARVDVKAQYTVPREQNLNLIDQNAIGQINYKDGSKALTGFDDDLEPRIVKLTSSSPDNRRWAFIIGAEQYLNADNIAYARRSAELFALVAQKSLGVPQNHLVTLYDAEATGGNIKGRLKKLFDQAISPGDTVYFYYNGHGVPNPAQGNTPFLLPTDMDQDYISDEPFFDLRNLYAFFRRSAAGQVVVFMDSCFTGVTDGRTVFQGKAATRLPPRKVVLPPTGNLAVITAGTDTQFSSAWPDKGHRLFSYHLIDTLASGTATVESLHTAVKRLVSSTSRQIGGTLSFQDPTLQGNGEIAF